MIRIVGWKAWFLVEDKLKTATSEDINFCVLPDTILGVKVFHSDETAHNFRGYDYYFQAEGLNGLIIACDIDVRERDVPRDIEQRYTKTVIKRGIWTDPGTMRIVEEEMQESKWQ